MAGKETTKPPGGASALEGQLDKLVAEASSAAGSPAPKATPKSKPKTESHDEAFKQAVNQIAAAPAEKADDVPSQSAEDLVGDDLANQIQELLDAAKASSGPVDSAVAKATEPPPVVAADAATTSDVSASPRSSSTTMSSVTKDTAAAVADGSIETDTSTEIVQADAFEKVDDAAKVEAEAFDKVDDAATIEAEAFDKVEGSTAEAEAAAFDKVDDTAAVKADAASVEQIDQMLAENADDAIAGDFETAAEVIAAEGETAADAAPPPPSAGGKIVIETNAKATRHDASAAPADAAGQEEEDLAGAFESPEDSDKAEIEHTKLVPNTTGETADESDAIPEGDTVAVESTEAHEPQAQAAPAAVKQAATPRGVKHSAPAEPAPPQPPAAHRRPSIVKRLCALINAPLANAQPWVRDGIGWVALITLFNGAVFLGMEISSNAMGGHAASIEAPHGELPSPSAHDAHGSSHGEKQSDPHAAAKKDDAHGAAKKDDGHGAAKKSDDAHGKKPEPKKSAKPDSHAKKDTGHGGGH